MSSSNAVQIYDVSAQSSQKQLMHSRQQLQSPFCIWSSPCRTEVHPTVADGSVPVSQLCHQHSHISKQVAEDMLATVPWTRLEAHSFGKQTHIGRNTGKRAMHARQVSFKDSRLRIMCINLSLQGLESKIVSCNT